MKGQSEQEQKRMIGERLYAKIEATEPTLAGKITGMLLEMENSAILQLLNDETELSKKIDEATQVLKEHNTPETVLSKKKRVSNQVRNCVCTEIGTFGYRAVCGRTTHIGHSEYIGTNHGNDQL